MSEFPRGFSPATALAAGFVSFARAPLAMPDRALSYAYAIFGHFTEQIFGKGRMKRSNPFRTVNAADRRKAKMLGASEERRVAITRPVEDFRVMQVAAATQTWQAKNLAPNGVCRITRYAATHLRSA